MAGGGLPPFDVPRVFWRSSSGWCWPRRWRPGSTSSPPPSGAIPEVAGDSATYFAPGDWIGLARTLAAGPLARSPGRVSSIGPSGLERYSTAAAAERLAAAYERALAL